MHSASQTRKLISVAGEQLTAAYIIFTSIVTALLSGSFGPFYKGFWRLTAFFPLAFMRLRSLKKMPWTFVSKANIQKQLYGEYIRKASTAKCQYTANKNIYIYTHICIYRYIYIFISIYIYIYTPILPLLLPHYLFLCPTTTTTTTKPHVWWLLFLEYVTLRSPSFEFTWQKLRFHLYS